MCRKLTFFTDSTEMKTYWWKQGVFYLPQVICCNSLVNIEIPWENQWSKTFGKDWKTFFQFVELPAMMKGKGTWCLHNYQYSGNVPPQISAKWTQFCHVPLEMMKYDKHPCLCCIAKKMWKQEEGKIPCQTSKQHPRGEQTCAWPSQRATYAISIRFSYMVLL